MSGMMMGAVGKSVTAGGGTPVASLGAMTLSDFQTTPAVASATLTVANDGSIGYSGNGSSGAPKWFNPATGTPGNSYWVRLTKTSGSNNSSGSALATALALTSGRTWTWNTPGNKVGTFTLEIASDVGMTTIVSTGTLSVDVESN